MTATIPVSPPARRKHALATLGPLIAAWIEQSLVHAQGDYYGQPFRLRRWQRKIVYRAYELHPDGRRRYDRVLAGLPKGNGKSELAAAIAAAEFAGPVMFDGWAEDGRPRGTARVSPDIPVAAASFEQADLVFGAVRVMLREGALRPFCEVYDTEILLKDRPGRLYRVAAVAGTNDGGRPTFFVADELHEWTGHKERVHLVLSNNRAKRRDAWELAITTAGWDSGSLLGRLYQHGRHLVAGETTDPGFLFIWWEASAPWALDDPIQLEAAIREANPAIGDFLALDRVVARYREVPEFEFRRYYLNQWVSAPERWLPLGAWDAQARPDRAVPDGAEIVLGFDGSYAGDSTALVGATLDGHLFVIALWEKLTSAPASWRVDILDVEEAVRRACQRWRVRAIGCDPFRWQRSLALLLEEGWPILEWPSHQPSRMAPACTQFYEAVTNELLTHDGHERLTMHIGHCVMKTDSRGSRIVKDHKDSERHIDLAVAAVIAYDLAVRQTRTGGWRPL